ncbi:DNA (cytosine-5-)-methyltransferase [Salinibacterium sp. ZJ454]|uniref:DNA (cytosine-5-)-methyltransferase n=1 Tax=Salinibacterium sp. ZJ454 TaxID=2708339 RepID=UPI00244463C7|nr:DNA (cytosine-5-)-methyltransferase [Salinibacterium sp. ZJ454]
MANYPDLQTPSTRLSEITALHGTPEVAKRMGTSRRTIERWVSGETRIPTHAVLAFDSAFGGLIPPGEPDREADITFIDLFAGIGGIRLGLESAGARCTFTSEWDKFAVRTYEANHDSAHRIVGDIREVDPADVPDHSVLAAGFPCQPFSLAGVSKKNSLGRKHGFLDPTQGTLFFNVAAILAEKRPRAFLLENVKNLLNHDGGNTFRVIRNVLEKDLGYTLHYRVVDANGFVPQHRERIILVGFRDGGDFDWDRIRPIAPAGSVTMDDVLHAENGPEPSAAPYVNPETGQVADKYVLSDRLWAYLQAYAAKHRAAGNGFGYGTVGRESTSRTLSARYHKDGSEILVRRGHGENPRRLTPRECARLMGFDDSFVIPVSDTQAYRQFGNSVAVPVMRAVAAQITTVLKSSAAERLAS